MQAPFSYTTHFNGDFSLVEFVTIEALQAKGGVHTVNFKLRGKSDCEEKELKCHELNSLFQILLQHNIKFYQANGFTSNSSCSCFRATPLKEEEEVEVKKVKKVTKIISPEKNSSHIYQEAFEECLALIKDKLRALKHQSKCFVVVPGFINHLFDEMYQYFEEAGLSVPRKKPNECDFAFNYNHTLNHHIICRLEIESEKDEWSNENLFEFLPLENKIIVNFAFTSTKKISSKNGGKNYYIDVSDPSDTEKFYLNMLTGIACAAGLPFIASDFMRDLKNLWLEKLEKYKLSLEPRVRIFAPLPLGSPPNSYILQAEEEKEPESLKEAVVEEAERENSDDYFWIEETKSPLSPSFAYEECLVILRSMDKPRDREEEVILFEIADPLGNFDEDTESYGLSGELEVLGFKLNEEKLKASNAIFVVYTKKYEINRQKCEEVRCHTDLLKDPKRTTVLLFKKCGALPPEIQALKDNGSLVVDLSDATHPQPYWERLQLFSKIMGVHLSPMPADRGEQSFELYLERKYKELIGIEEYSTPELNAYQECLSLIKMEVESNAKKCVLIDFDDSAANPEAFSFSHDLKSAGFSLIWHAQSRDPEIAKGADGIVVRIPKKYSNLSANRQAEFKIFKSLIFSHFENKRNKVIVIKREDFNDDSLNLKGCFSIIENNDKKGAELFWIKLERIVHLAGIADKRITKNGIEKSFIAFLYDQWQKKLNPFSDQSEEEEASWEKIEKEEVPQTPKEFKREDCICPITRRYMKNPVTASDGSNYEAWAIEKWMEENGTSPITRERLSKILTPNPALRAASERFRKFSSADP
ncbi:U-box domain-containing protein [Parachlamydia sp. AcF125]|uniref:U-box domain-containing protein n=1 Tax=Parachlamydia sp. AcF125 TaxID=2795736 RepID=UPI001BC8EDF3|nr:U-box domain-containing protein [Parachlamydia sp. AcF125]MBS4168544.1 hypothetical protein [Parachlamydia sp. AcF125]